jgi:hypothetical protein
MKSGIAHLATLPPRWPSVFYGRDDLVAELTNFIVNKQVALS